MALPTAKNKIKTDIRDLVTLIYGAPKIGKSTFCSNADGAIFLATEPGLSFLEVYSVDVQSWADFAGVYKELAAGNHQFRTVVIDTIDNLYKMCVEYVLGKKHVEHQSDLEYGKGYDLVNNEFHRRLRDLSLLPYGVMMTSHSVEKEVKTRTGKETRIAPTLPGSARRTVLGMCDFIFYAEMQEVRNDREHITGYERVIHTQPTTIYEAGNRSQFVLPDPLPLDYAAFTSAFADAVKQHNQPSTPTATTQTGGK